MPDKYLKKSHVYLIIILIAATLVTMSSTVLTYRNAINAAEDFLKLQALGIAISLEASLSTMAPERQNIFKDMIAGGKWEGIAFIALYDKNGLTILHSNKNLIGRQIEDRFIETVADKGEPFYIYTMLGTEEKVFVLYSLLRIRDDKRVLKVALHTYPSEKIIRQARLQMVSISFVISILWIMGCLFIRAIKRSEEMKKAMAEKERLAVIGEMASVLAHEIRNPLSSIKGFAQYLKEQSGRGGEKRSETDGRDYIDIIISESKRLETLTEDLLIYARPVEVKIEELDINELINEVVQSINKKPAIEIKILLPAGLKIKSDKDKLRQILINVIQNSIDSINEGGIIEIKANVIKDKLAISILDNGYGMDVEIKENAFKPFFTTKTKGTGLGLAIVDKLTKAIGGSIKIESEINEGTTFKIIIPGILI